MLHPRATTTTTHQAAPATAQRPTTPTHPEFKSILADIERTYKALGVRLPPDLDMYDPILGYADSIAQATGLLNRWARRLITENLELSIQLRLEQAYDRCCYRLVELNREHASRRSASGSFSSVSSHTSSVDNASSYESGDSSGDDDEYCSPADDEDWMSQLSPTHSPKAPKANAVGVSNAGAASATTTTTTTSGSALPARRRLYPVVGAASAAASNVSFAANAASFFPSSSPEPGAQGGDEDAKCGGDKCDNIRPYFRMLIQCRLQVVVSATQMQSLREVIKPGLFHTSVASVLAGFVPGSVISESEINSQQVIALFEFCCRLRNHLLCHYYFSESEPGQSLASTLSKLISQRRADFPHAKRGIDAVIARYDNMLGEHPGFDKVTYIKACRELLVSYCNDVHQAYLSAFKAGNARTAFALYKKGLELIVLLSDTTATIGAGQQTALTRLLAHAGCGDIDIDDAGPAESFTAMRGYLTYAANKVKNTGVKQKINELLLRFDARANARIKVALLCEYHIQSGTSSQAANSAAAAAAATRVAPC